jgi:enamine deaminase RidA (YjgF/YER057c/UK114 family)
MRATTGSEPAGPGTPEARLERAGFVLPPLLPAVGGYTPVRLLGSLAFVSGHGAVEDGRAVLGGRVGDDVTIEDGRRSAALATLSALASLRHAVGSLARVAGAVRLLVFVNATPSFDRHPLVADGASEVLNVAFGESPGHARAAIGVASLPFGISTEIEAVFELAASSTPSSPEPRTRSPF